MSYNWQQWKHPLVAEVDCPVGLYLNDHDPLVLTQNLRYYHNTITKILSKKFYILYQFQDKQ